MPNLIGQSLGRYHILEQLGEGGMAIVYKAYDTRLERDVAVKVIRTEKLTIETMGKTLKRFEREAKALAKLTHPNIVPITDYGEHDEKPYLVMPFLPGGTLKQQLKGKPMRWEESVRLLIPIARALHYAHQQGIIHRDVKPSNILITQSGEPMLTDFGIAKILLDNEETADLTGTGMGVGTPEYMSAEQFQGKGVDARTDVYSLGVVLYEMVTGRKPYQADTPAAVLVKQVTEALPRPRKFISELPDDVEKLLLKTLAKDKDDRYQNVSEMVHAMENLFGHTKTAMAVISMAGEPKKSTSHIPEKSTIDTMATVMQDEPSRSTLATVDSEIPVAGAGSVHSSNVSPIQRTTTKHEAKLPIAWIVIGFVVLAISLLVGIGSWQQAQSIRATATDQAYQFQATATAQAYANRIPILVNNVKRLQSFREYYSQGWVESIIFSPDGSLLVWSGEQGVWVYDHSRDEQLHHLTGHGVQVHCISFNGDGNILTSSGADPDRTTRLWDVNLGIEQHLYYAPSGSFGVCSKINPVDDTLFASVSGAEWWITDVESGNRTNLVNPDGYLSLGISWSPDGKFLVIGGFESQLVYVLDLSTKSVLKKFQHDDSVGDVFFSPDGLYIAAQDERMVRLWQLKDGSYQKLLFHDAYPVRLSFSPDGTILAVGVSDGTIQLFKMPSGEKVSVLNGGIGNVILSFSPDGTLLASASSDGLVRIWGIAP